MDREWKVGDVVLVKGCDKHPSKHRIIRKTPKRGVLDDGRQFWLESGRLVRQYGLLVVFATDDLLTLYEKEEQARAEKERKANHRCSLQDKAYKAIDHMRIGYFHYCSDEQLEKVIAVFEEVFPHLYSQEEGRE